MTVQPFEMKSVILNKVDKSFSIALNSWTRILEEIPDLLYRLFLFIHKASGQSQHMIGIKRERAVLSGLFIRSHHVLSDKPGKCFIRNEHEVADIDLVCSKRDIPPAAVFTGVPEVADLKMIRMRQAAQNDWLTMKNSERKAGKIEILAALVKDGILTLESAAERAGMSVQSFSKEAQTK